MFPCARGHLLRFEPPLLPGSVSLVGRSLCRWRLGYLIRAHQRNPHHAPTASSYMAVAGTGKAICSQ